MINYQQFTAGATGTAVSAAGFALSVTQLQAILSLTATIIGLVITVATSIVIPVIHKIIEAKKDGKITKDEAIDIVDTAKDGLDKVKDEIKKIDGGKNE